MSVRKSKRVRFVRVAIPTFAYLSACFYVLQTASYVVYVTMPLPFLLLLVLLIRAVTLPGAGDGINAYLGQWDFSILSNPGYVGPFGTQVKDSIVDARDREQALQPEQHLP